MSWKLANEAMNNPREVKLGNSLYLSNEGFIYFNGGAWKDNFHYDYSPDFDKPGWYKFEEPKEKVKYTKYFYLSGNGDLRTLKESDWFISGTEVPTTRTIVAAEEREF